MPAYYVIASKKEIYIIMSLFSILHGKGGKIIVPSKRILMHENEQWYANLMNDIVCIGKRKALTTSTTK